MEWHIGIINGGRGRDSVFLIKNSCYFGVGSLGFCSVRERLGIYCFFSVLTAFLLVGCSYNTSTPQDNRKDPYFMKGMEQNARKEYQAALESFEQALRNNPDNAAAHYELGMIYEVQVRDNISAVYHYQRYLALRKKEGKDDLLIEGRMDNCLQTLMDHSNVIPRPPMYEKEVSDLLKNKQTLEASVKSLSEAYEKLRAMNEDLRMRLQQQDQALRQAQKQLGTNMALPSIPTTMSMPEQFTEAVRRSDASTAQAISSGKIEIYTIRKGDTFQKIAKNLNVSERKIVELNPNVDSRRLQIGQQIKVPGK